MNELLNIFKKFSLQQKIVIGGTAAISILLFAALFIFLNEPSYAPLYSNLSQEDASKVVDFLSSQKIPYKIEGNGTTVEVEKDKVYETRLSLAGKGIPSSGIMGYEIFDKNTMGMSEFMQKLNYKRALEGELARTIMQQEGVEGARVQIVIPTKSIFKDEEKKPTASVVLKLNNSNGMSKSNVNAILNLVASSVEGLTPDRVTLLDTKGRLLSKEIDQNPFAVSSTKQYEIKQSIENYLALKAQSIMDNVLGYGNAMVQVNVDLNFDQVEKTMESYDPDSQVAISEQTVKTENGGKNLSDSSSQSSQNSTVNYEISKTIQKVIEGTGNIKRLTVAAVVNDVAKEVKKDDKTEIVYEPRSQEQLKKLEEIIKNAVGINPTRNDVFSIVNIPFETKQFDDIKVQEPSFLDNIDQYTNILLIIVAIIASIFVLKGLMNKLKNERIVIGTYSNDSAPQLEAITGSNAAINIPQQAAVQQGRKKQYLPVGDLEDEITDEAIRKQNEQEKIMNYVSKNPMDAAKLINAWLHEDELYSR